MKIKEIETIFADRFMFVRVTTDTGLTGIGESGAWGYLEASAQAVETFKRYLIGRDPLRIEHHSPTSGVQPLWGPSVPST